MERDRCHRCQSSRSLRQPRCRDRCAAQRQPAVLRMLLEAEGDGRQVPHKGPISASWVPSVLPSSTKVTSAAAMVSPPGRCEPDEALDNRHELGSQLADVVGFIEAGMTIERHASPPSGIDRLCFSVPGGRHALPRSACASGIRSELFFPITIGQAQRTQTVLGGDHGLPACGRNRRSDPVQVQRLGDRHVDALDDALLAILHAALVLMEVFAPRFGSERRSTSPASRPRRRLRAPSHPPTAPSAPSPAGREGAWAVVESPGLTNGMVDRAAERRESVRLDLRRFAAGQVQRQVDVVDHQVENDVDIGIAAP